MDAGYDLNLRYTAWKTRLDSKTYMVAPVVVLCTWMDIFPEALFLLTLNSCLVLLSSVWSLIGSIYRHFLSPRYNSKFFFLGYFKNISLHWLQLLYPSLLDLMTYVTYFQRWCQDLKISHSYISFVVENLQPFCAFLKINSLCFPYTEKQHNFSESTLNH